MARKGINQITVYCSKELKDKIELSANDKEISASSWLKMAAVEKLNREGRK